MRLCTILLTAFLLGPAVANETVTVAVASNFTGAMQEIALRFEEQTGHSIALSPGSTGKHYAQIVHGAPFDLFFAADSARPRKLEEGGQAVRDTRFTYAIGTLVLWSPDPGRVDPSGEVLGGGDFRFLAIANPDLAPYGRAARETLQALGLWSFLESRLVRGENIGQAFQFVHSGNAELGLVATSQVSRPGRPLTGSGWTVPQDLYTPIEQQAVLLKDSRGGREFLAFIRGEEALRVIENYGYLAP